MTALFLTRLLAPKQYLISAVLILGVSGLCYAFTAYLDYHVVAFILLVLVSFIAMIFDILPVLLSAVFTGFTWDFFFIPPHFTITVAKTEDKILLLTYL